MTRPASERWEQIAESGDFALLDQLLADDVVFESPVVHTPQVGRAITKAYLIAAVKVLNSPKFRWVNRWFSGQSAVLELATEIDGLTINAVDIINWNSEGRITHFKVMVRPLKAINALHRAMGKQLAATPAESPG
jgi:SnoaL-like domain